MADRLAQTATNLVEYTVSELAFALRRTVEDNFGLVKLRGEISGFRGRHSSGHCYFTLKDENACIEAVIWKSTFVRLKFKPSIVPAHLERLFERMVKTIFMQRRKTLLNALRPFAESLQRDPGSMLAAAGIDPQRRPETLAAEELLRLVQVVL